MAQMVRVTQVCDLDGTEGTPDEVQTHKFRYQNDEYEIDLDETCAKGFREVFEKYVQSARKLGATSRAASRGTVRPRSRRRQAADARAWAKERGLMSSERGRIPVEVMKQYEAWSKATATAET